MNIKKSEIAEKIYLLEFDNQFELTSTLLRFQEFYESPKFKGKIFTLDEFKRWYSKLKGSFSYYKDWNGFNIPSRILKPFYLGKFNPLSDKEKQILELFKSEKENDYIIAIHKSGIFRFSYFRKMLLNHEIAHALFHTNKKYKKECLNLIRKYNLEEAKKKLLKSGGYSKEVLEDEIQAYSITSGRLRPKIPYKLKKSIRKLFKEQLQ